jgi:hypothetical protein
MRQEVVAEASTSASPAAYFNSVLFGDMDQPLNHDAPAAFRDLNLDQIVAAIAGANAAYDLAPFFYTTCNSVELARARQSVLADLEEPGCAEALSVFTASMQAARAALEHSEKARYPLEKQRWRFDAVHLYCEAADKLAHAFQALPLKSRLLIAFANFLTDHTKSPPVAAMREEARAIANELAAIRYCVEISGLVVKVGRFNGEMDYNLAVAETFAPFAQNAPNQYAFRTARGTGMNRIEAQILDLVTVLFPNAFASLAQFVSAHEDFLDPTITRFDREIQFYRGYLAFIAPIRAQGLVFCAPRFGAEKNLLITDGFDLALAALLAPRGAPVVMNDAELSDAERMFVVSGPNQGGKTTFARMIGQAYYLAGLGLYTPGRTVSLHLCDRIFSHFERGENAADLRGKLQDDLMRLHDMLGAASRRSLFLFNEIFTSTSLEDATILSQAIMDKIRALDALAVWVTFIEELASPAPNIVSMTSVVDENDPAIRTFKVLRRRPDGVSHALSIAKKHGLTTEQITKRLSQ